MRQLIVSFPSLRLFEMTTTNSSLLPFSPPLELSLVSVKFNTHLVQDIGPCLASLLRQDGHGEPLQLLRHESTSRIHAVLGPVLVEHGPHLRSLSVKALLDVAQAPLALCTTLEHFEFWAFPDSATLAAIPRTITTLAIRNNSYSESDAETLAGELLAFPRLKVFIWTRCVQSGDLFHMLERRCAERGIAFCTYTGQTVRVSDDFTFSDA
jgi:hypothetical protein